jgi:hypothetical protein
VIVRVVQWATGAVGAAQLREVVDRPDLELVGLFVYDPAKVGVDAGELVGRAATGVTATDDKDAILALDADVLGLELDEIRHSIETGVVDHDVEVACGTLPAGSVVGQIMSWSGYHNGEAVLVAQE